MIKNLFLHFLLCLGLSFLISVLQVELGGYCESMCGLYYFLGATLLLPVLFIIGLSIPIGKALYPKDNQLVSKKRKLSILFGVTGMVITIFAYVAWLYYSANTIKWPPIFRPILKERFSSKYRLIIGGYYYEYKTKITQCKI